MKDIRRLLFSGPSGQGAAAAPHSRDRANEFKRLVLPHFDGAYNFARYLTRDPVLSDDIVQDAFVRAFRSFDQIRGTSYRAWLFAIVRNCCRTAQSATTGRLTLVHESALHPDETKRLEEEADTAPSPEDALVRKSDAEKLHEAIDALPEPFREAIVLRELEELSYAEISQVTGVPMGTVMSRLSRGRSILAQLLLPAGKNGDEIARSVK